MRPGRLITVLILFAAAIIRARAQTVISLPLTTGGTNTIDLGFFSAGTQLQISVTGTGDLTSSDYQTNPDGSLAATAVGAYTFANSGATYGSVGGFPAGDGINHFAGGGSNYDFSGSGWMFAGLQTTDTTDPQAIRAGAVVGTFVANPTRTDWFLIGDGGLFTIPGGGAHLYLAVNDSYSGDNHGSYSFSYAAVPEPTVATLLGCGLTVCALAFGLRQFFGRKAFITASFVSRRGPPMRSIQ